MTQTNGFIICILFPTCNSSLSTLMVNRKEGVKPHDATNLEVLSYDHMWIAVQNS